MTMLVGVTKSPHHNQLDFTVKGDLNVKGHDEETGQQPQEGNRNSDHQGSFAEHCSPAAGAAATSLDYSSH